MAALTKDRETDYKEGELLAVPVAASAVIYKGSLVCRNTSGYAVPAADTASFVFEGVAFEKVDNTGGANGAKSIRVRKRGIHYFAASGMAITDVGKAAFVVDDQTVGLAATTTNDIEVGDIADFVSATNVGVEISAVKRLLGGSVTDAILESPAAIGLTAGRVAKAQYLFATHGGAQGTISLGVQLPINAIVLDGMMEVLTAPTSGGAATIAVQTEAANDIITAAAISGAPWSTLGRKDIIPVGTAATSKKMTAARNISIVIGTADLTAGKFNVFLRYVVSD